MQLLYDADVLSEEGIEAWASAKEEDAEEDQVYLKKVRYSSRVICAVACTYLIYLRNKS